MKPSFGFKDMNSFHIEKLRGLEGHLLSKIRGQEEAIKKIVPYLQQGEMGLTAEDEPRGSFLFLGPTGVGKTETALTFSRYLFGDEKLFRFDMSEFASEESLREFRGWFELDGSGKIVENLGRLGEVLAAHEKGVLFFDEMEKAHSKVLMLFLQMLSAARITCGDNRLFSLKNFYLVFTSNIGGADVMHARHLRSTQVEKRILLMLRTVLPPEFGPRIKCKAVFQKLSVETQYAIARDILQSEVSRLRALGHVVEIPDEALPRLVEQGYDRINGARPMRDAVQFFVRNHAAVMMRTVVNLNDDRPKLI
jgi:ATP-dependent Clp protease ATP-binding subunit ClpA